jgi:hypothetical protein
MWWADLFGYTQLVNLCYRRVEVWSASGMATRQYDRDIPQRIVLILWSQEISAAEEISMGRTSCI